MGGVSKTLRARAWKGGEGCWGGGGATLPGAQGDENVGGKHWPLGAPPRSRAASLEALVAPEGHPALLLCGFRGFWRVGEQHQPLHLRWQG